MIVCSRLKICWISVETFLKIDKVHIRKQIPTWNQVKSSKILPSNLKLSKTAKRKNQNVFLVEITTDNYSFATPPVKNKNKRKAATLILKYRTLQKRNKIRVIRKVQIRSLSATLTSKPLPTPASRKWSTRRHFHLRNMAKFLKNRGYNLIRKLHWI